jgi:hypothetical protein
MTFRERLAQLRQNPVVRYGLLVFGVLMMLVSPIVGLLPGPGGIFVFAIGLGLTLQNSMWARRRYVELKRSQPKIGSWTDWGLRRASPKRREEIKKKQAEAGDN